ncbi:uncharacterized protein EDB91DRAFT_1087653 [Suillus paluster]|uniref:uncharacterized protein n=1 Tax=Suillus paluster TaxID=48578 RepID=UPI001B884E7B|nr:uncharacterized protein EDB91DRAFT_1087653 [Suillus paluster]KAG1723912.1 hypothetical protein EDB91DRAFT_1087653 [Suillus paluster]
MTPESIYGMDVKNWTAIAVGEYLLKIYGPSASTSSNQNSGAVHLPCQTGVNLSVTQTPATNVPDSENTSPRSCTGSSSCTTTISSVSTTTPPPLPPPLSPPLLSQLPTSSTGAMMDLHLERNHDGTESDAGRQSASLQMQNDCNHLLGDGSRGSGANPKQSILPVSQLMPQAKDFPLQSLPSVWWSCLTVLSPHFPGYRIPFELMGKFNTVIWGLRELLDMIHLFLLSICFPELGTLLCISHYRTLDQMIFSQSSIPPSLLATSMTWPTSLHFLLMLAGPRQQKAILWLDYEICLPPRLASEEAVGNDFNHEGHTDDEDDNYDTSDLQLDWENMDLIDIDGEVEGEGKGKGKDKDEGEGEDTLWSKEDSLEMESLMNLEAMDDEASYPVILNSVQIQQAKMLRECCSNDSFSEEQCIEAYHTLLLSVFTTHTTRILYAALFSILTHVMNTPDPYQTFISSMKKWINPDFTFDRKPLSITSITQMYHSVYHEMVHILEEHLLFGAGDTVLQPLKKPEEITDKPHEHIIGHGVLVSEMEVAWTPIKFIMNNEKLLKKYFSIGSTSRNPVPHKGAWEEYLEHVETFKEHFYFLFHQIPGMPKRGTEEIWAKIVDTSFCSRNIMYLFHHLACIGDYSKTSRNPSNDKLTLHFLAHPLEMVLRRYQASVTSPTVISDPIPLHSYNDLCDRISSLERTLKNKDEDLNKCFTSLEGSLAKMMHMVSSILQAVQPSHSAAGAALSAIQLPQSSNSDTSCLIAS